VHDRNQHIRHVNFHVSMGVQMYTNMKSDSCWNVSVQGEQDNMIQFTDKVHHKKGIITKVALSQQHVMRSRGIISFTVLS